MVATRWAWNGFHTRETVPAQTNSVLVGAAAN
jgi:hypothetical protein